MAITIVTQYDIAHMHKIENKISKFFTQSTKFLGFYA